MFRFVAVLLLVTGFQATASIVTVAPNPYAYDDHGEYVVLEFPRETDLSNWSLTDGKTTARFPDETVEGRVVATIDPERVRNTTDLPVVELRDHIKFANDGETIGLRRGNETVDEAEYDRAPEGERFVRTDDGWEWRHPSRTDRAVTSRGSADARLFVLPDAPEEPVAALESATDRILLAGYTFGSRRVVTTLCDARERGVTVRVLVERGPVGGMTDRSASLLDDLAACDVDVVVQGGEGSRYAFHHAKYAVVDDSALVLTENWGPAGTGGRSSRGWGIVVDSEPVTQDLVDVFETDAVGRDADDWTAIRGRIDPVASDPPLDQRFPARFEPRRTRVDGVELVVAPDNAEERFVELIDGAAESVRVKQLSVGSRGQPFVRALLRAAERGVRVRVLLSSEWYVLDGNSAIVRWLNDRASRDGLPIEARLAEPRSRYGKVHAKGIVVDEEITIVGSVNWNNASVRDNREVALVVHGETAGEYYADVFRADWRGGTWRLPVGIAAACGLFAGGSAVVARRVRFDGQWSSRS